MRKFIFTIFILSFLISEISANDFTVKEVGPGFKHHTIYISDGPFHINILEIDLTQRGNKITAVLANDLLGNGVERTSSMARRKSNFSHIVIGAVNGDFFGIREPHNPYTFLSNSMIINREFVFGRSRNRSSFGVRNENIPLIDIINFRAELTVGEGKNIAIDLLNGERLENHLILYNSYFGASTKTDPNGTEVRLFPLSDLSINGYLSFLVTGKEQGVGDMSIGMEDYILSGDGKGQEFLDLFVNVGDTITLYIGTEPDLGNITTLMGGGPRLVINGSRPESFVGFEGFGSGVNNRAPRTAVGFNQDSTIVYFVTVDGRQEGFSDGMSIPELADYLISMGVHNAVNLDGGGSTTMAVRDTVRNSPSDFYGERFVASALLAVTTINVSEIIDRISLSPKFMYIESNETGLIQVNAIDKWGYTLPITAGDIEWRVHEISGTVDSNGNFIAYEIGTGYITGRIDTTIDTVMVKAIEGDEYHLEQNFPNPFNPITTILYSVPHPGHVSLLIYNIAGQRVDTLVDSFHENGRYIVEWDASNFPSGTYFYTLSTETGFHKTRKMVIVK